MARSSTPPGSDPGLALSWVEIGAAALTDNLAVFRRLAGPNRQLMVVVKADAYGHGLEPVGRLAVTAGADWLAVFTITEAMALRGAGITVPVLVLGPCPPGALSWAATEQVRLTVASPAAVEPIAAAQPDGLKVHVKLETGTNRQGFGDDEDDQVHRLGDVPGVTIEGVYTHFADIEDTTDHGFAREQLARFEGRVARLRAAGIAPERIHTSCSAATLLFPETYFDMVRVGVSAYGLWPSKETLVSAREAGRQPVALSPVMTWRTRVAQVKTVAAGETVGYGRTFKTTRPTRLAILPVGYANGYDRRLSNTAHVLVRGQRARLAGRVMMNMIAVDVSDIAGAEAGDEVVLLGCQGDETITASELAAWIGTIHYEVVTRVEPGAPRRVV